MTQSLLEFGKRFASPEGSAYYHGDDGTPWVDRPRETWITCRMAHVYSMGYMLGYPDGQKLVQAAMKGLTGELRDKEFGGWYSGITRDGKRLPNKQCYAHAFVILAASSAILADVPGAEKLLRDDAYCGSISCNSRCDRKSDLPNPCGADYPACN